MRKLLEIGGMLSMCVAAIFPANAVERGIPRPLPSHPGNIFLADEKIVVSAPAGEGEKWRAIDYDGKTVAEGVVKNERAEIGSLPVGYYEVVRGVRDISNRVSVGVLEPLHVPTPRTSPIGIDVALAWSYSKEQMPGVACLCQLAGMNRVRDRFYWGELEPKRGEIVTTKTRYDYSLDAQAAAGLQVLNVNHASPTWANPNGKHFPIDLRDIHNFFRPCSKPTAIQN